MEKIYVHISESYQQDSFSQIYKSAFKDLYRKNQIKTFLYYIYKTNEEIVEEKDWIRYIGKKNEKEMKQSIIQISSEFEIIFINTFSEKYIDFVHSVKKELWHPYTKTYKLFRDKSLQRELLEKYDPKLTIQYKKIKGEKEELGVIVESLWYPFIIKPVSWIQSAGVSIIENESDYVTYLKNESLLQRNFENRGYNTSQLIVEEYIDGSMYSIDYFVNAQWKIIYSPPVQVKIGKDIGINDFMNYVRTFSQNQSHYPSEQELHSYFWDCVNALGLCNTFIHHEFKYTSKWKLKTIEVNGRIGWYRLEMIQESFNFNWLSVITSRKFTPIIKYNFSIFLIYAPRRGIFEKFEEKYIESIKKLPSLYRYKILEDFVGKEIGLTKDGFTKVAIIKIKHSNLLQFEKDFFFLEENYKDFLVLKNITD